MSKRLEKQELENARQAKIISQQGAIIGRLEEALFASDRKLKPDVLKTGKIDAFIFFKQITYITH